MRKSVVQRSIPVLRIWLLSVDKQKERVFRDEMTVPKQLCKNAKSIKRFLEQHYNNDTTQFLEIKGIDELEAICRMPLYDYYLNSESYFVKGD